MALVLIDNFNLKQVQVVPIKKEDSTVTYGEAGNYSITGFEMILTRNTAK
jgi:hypothetical protein